MKESKGCPYFICGESEGGSGGCLIEEDILDPDNQLDDNGEIWAAKRVHSNCPKMEQLMVKYADIIERSRLRHLELAGYV